MEEERKEEEKKEKKRNEKERKENFTPCFEVGVSDVIFLFV